MSKKKEAHSYICKTKCFFQGRRRRVGNKYTLEGNPKDIPSHFRLVEDGKKKSDIVDEIKKKKIKDMKKDELVIYAKEVLDVKVSANMGVDAIREIVKKRYDEIQPNDDE